jgi:uncharacterized protein DUF3303
VHNVDAAPVSASEQLLQGVVDEISRANARDGVKIIGRWHDFAGCTGVLIVEANDLAVVQRYIGQWEPSNGHLSHARCR